MRRSDIAKALMARNRDLPASVIEKSLDTFFDAIVATLADGGRAELRGFGTFSTRSRNAAQDAIRGAAIR